MKKFTTKPTTLYRIKTYKPEPIDKYRQLNITKRNLKEKYIENNPTQQQLSLLKHKATHIPDLQKTKREKREVIDIIPNFKIKSEQAKMERTSLTEEQPTYQQKIAGIRKQQIAYREARREWTLKTAQKNKFDIGYELEDKKLAANFHFKNWEEDVIY